MAASRQLVLKGVPFLRIIQHSPYIVRTGDPIRLDCVSLSAIPEAVHPAPSPAGPSQQIEAGSFLRWTKQGQAITSYSSQDVHGPTRSLVIRRVAPSDAGHYVCTCCTQHPDSTSSTTIEQIDQETSQNETMVEERILVIGMDAIIEIVTSPQSQMEFH